MEITIEECIKSCLSCVAGAECGAEAMQYAQAVLNLAHARQVIVQTNKSAK